jgi:hypothetical protein
VRKRGKTNLLLTAQRLLSDLTVEKVMWHGLWSSAFEKQKISSFFPAHIDGDAVPWQWLTWDGYETV